MPQGGRARRETKGKRSVSPAALPPERRHLLLRSTQLRMIALLLLAGTRTLLSTHLLPTLCSLPPCIFSFSSRLATHLSWSCHYLIVCTSEHSAGSGIAIAVACASRGAPTKARTRPVETRALRQLPGTTTRRKPQRGKSARTAACEAGALLSFECATLTCVESSASCPRSLLLPDCSGPTCPRVSLRWSWTRA